MTNPFWFDTRGRFYFPVLSAYPETLFGGDFETEAEYRDPFVQELIEKDGWIIWPLVPFRYDTINYDLKHPAPAPPSTTKTNLGTDDQARDVTARLIYGFRLSVLFALALTAFSSVVGIAAGAVQGYLGGWVDLIFQRFIENLGADCPPCLSSLLSPVLLSRLSGRSWSSLLLFSWMRLVGVVRAEFLRARNFDFVRAARALGVNDLTIMWRHVLPNAMVATTDLFALCARGICHGIDLAGLSRFWPSATFSLAGRIAQSGQAQLAGSLAGSVRIFCSRNYVIATRIYRRGRARCI